jgi:hypothetical protein
MDADLRKGNPMRTLLAATLLVLCAPACGSCRKPSASAPVDSPPLADTAPSGGLGPSGIALDQTSGESASGQWTAISGWLDPSRYRALLVIGAPRDGFYLQTGHQGVPSVPLSLRADGRFVAPRVPLENGKTEIQVIPFPAKEDGTAAIEPIKLTLSVTNDSVAPATIVAKPEFGKAPLKVDLHAYGEGTSDWQWDYESDGIFDESISASAGATHIYEKAGQHMVTARRQKGGKWVYAVASISVSGEAGVLAETSVEAPSAVSVEFDWNRLREMRRAGGTKEAVTDDAAFVGRVLVLDGDALKIFDARLALLRTIRGFSQPQGVVSDHLGRIYVADSGRDQIVALTRDGARDPTFGTDGAFSGTVDLPLKHPTTLLSATAMGKSVLAGPDAGTKYRDTTDTVLLILDQGNDRILRCRRPEQGDITCATFPTSSSELPQAKGITTFTMDVCDGFGSSAIERLALADRTRLIKTEPDELGSDGSRSASHTACRPRHSGQLQGHLFPRRRFIRAPRMGFCPRHRAAPR